MVSGADFLDWGTELFMLDGVLLVIYSRFTDHILGRFVYYYDLKTPPRPAEPSELLEILKFELKSNQTFATKKIKIE